MNKKQLIEKFKAGTSFMVVTEGHKFYGVPRKADKIQTGAIKFEGGSWLYFKDIKPSNISDSGFKIESLGFRGGFIEYAEVKNG